MWASQKLYIRNSKWRLITSSIEHVLQGTVIASCCSGHLLASSISLTSLSILSLSLRSLISCSLLFISLQNCSCSTSLSSITLCSNAIALETLCADARRLLFVNSTDSTVWFLMQGGREVSSNCSSRFSALQFASVGWFWFRIVDSESLARGTKRSGQLWAADSTEFVLTFWSNEKSTEALTGKAISVFTAGSAF